MTGRDDDVDEMMNQIPHVSDLLAEVELADDPTVVAVLTAVADLGQGAPPKPTGELAALLEGTVRPIGRGGRRGGGGGQRRVVTMTTLTIASVVALSATTAAAVTGVRQYWPESGGDGDGWSLSAPEVVTDAAPSASPVLPGPTDLPGAHPISPAEPASSRAGQERAPALMSDPGEDAAPPEDGGSHDVSSPDVTTQAAPPSTSHGSSSGERLTEFSSSTTPAVKPARGNTTPGVGNQGNTTPGVGNQGNTTPGVGNRGNTAHGNPGNPGNSGNPDAAQRGNTTPGVGNQGKTAHGNPNQGTGNHGASGSVPGQGAESTTSD